MIRRDTRRGTQVFLRLPSGQGWSDRTLSKPWESTPGRWLVMVGGVPGGQPIDEIDYLYPEQEGSSD